LQRGVNFDYGGPKDKEQHGNEQGLTSMPHNRVLRLSGAPWLDAARQSGLASARNPQTKVFARKITMSLCLYVVQMDVPPELEADFNRIYDTQHIPEIMKVPGVLGVKRYMLEKSAVPGVPKYTAVYRVTSTDVPHSAAWIVASDTGEWKPRIRPHTTNRIHSLCRELP
jgi:hypothetical protein